MKKLMLLFIIFSVASIIKASNSYLKVLYIADSTIEKDGHLCLFVRENPSDSFSIFEHQIEGFTFENGYEYCILVEVQTKVDSSILNKNPTTSTIYTLSEIKSKHKTSSSFSSAKNFIPDSSKWTLYKLRLQDGTKTFTLQQAFILFDAQRNIISGNTDCNTFTADFSVDSNQIQIHNIITSKMTCKKHSIEKMFLQMLNNSTQYIIKKKILYFYQQKKLLGIFIRKADI